MKDLTACAAIFDMDGLMFDTERLAAEGLYIAGRSMGLPVTREITDKTVGRDKANARWVFAQSFGEEVDFERVWALTDEYMLNSVSTVGLPLKDGIVELIDYLKRRGCNIALATGSAGHIVQHYFAHFNAADSFDAIICSDMVRRGKPDPEVFLAAAKAVDVPPENCIVFEDSPSGVLAAYRAGMRAVMVPDLIPAGAEEFAHAKVLCSLLEAPAYLDSIEWC